MDAHTQGLFLGFGLVMLSVIAAVIVKQIQLGGTGFGHLDKTVNVPFNKLNLDFQKKFFRQRLAALGFKPLKDENVFIQGGTNLGDFGATSHAKTPKQITLRFPESATDNLVAKVTLRYLDIVVVDTGESGYRDAALDFVAGHVDEMKTVPTESFMALNSLIGGAAACATVIILMVSDKLALWTAIPTIGVTEFGVGLLGLFTIMQKPTEITGRWKAIVGILLSLASITVGLYYIISRHSSSPL